jgi:F-type H+-transporting ATPase subunit delta
LKQLEELEAIAASVASSKNLKLLLKSPSFSLQEKWQVLEEILKQTNASKEIGQVLKVLVDSGRILLIEEVVSEFKKVMMDRAGEAEATIESAYALTESELTLVKANLEKTIGKKLRIKTEVDSKIVAGLKIHVDGKTLDGTLATHLNKLQKQLIRAEA